MLNASPSATLQMRSIDGDPIQCAVVGEPFLFEVVLSDGQSAQRPHIDGLGAFVIKSAGVMMYSVNNATTTTYRFTARVDAPGTYEVGPAHVYIDGHELASEKLLVRVLDQNAPELQARQTSERAEPALVRLSFDTDRAVVGQRVTCCLQFCCIAKKAEFEQVYEPDFSAFKIGARTGPQVKTELINGVNYQVHEWSWQLYPTKAGRLTVPAVAADYFVQARGHGFSAFFMRHAERRRVYSRAAFLPVDAIETNEQLYGVGRFLQFQAQISPSMATVGEGIVLSLNITGNGDFEHADFPDLNGIPEGLKWYTSKRVVHDAQADGMQTVSYEYIVQGMQPGEYIIPVQQIAVFDTQAGQVKKMETVPLSLTVAGVRNNGSAAPAETEKPYAGQRVTAEETDVREFKATGLHAWDGGLGPVRTRAMPWYLFFVLVCLAGLCAMRTACARFLHVLGGVFYRVGYARRVHHAIDQACAQQRPDQLYQIFMHFLSQKIGISTACLSETVIGQYVQRCQLSAGEHAEWMTFFTQLQEAAFAPIEPRTLSMLAKQAKKWVTRMQKVK